VDRFTMSTRFPHVFAIGDNVQIPLSVGKPLPRAGVFARAQGRVVAHRISDEIEGRTPRARFDGHGACFIEAGRSRAGFGSGDFYAEPAPAIRLRSPSRWFHAGKVLLERQALGRWL